MSTLLIATDWGNVAVDVIGTLLECSSSFSLFCFFSYYKFVHNIVCNVVQPARSDFKIIIFIKNYIGLRKNAKSVFTLNCIVPLKLLKFVIKKHNLLILTLG